jgi:hypothetical protein
MTQALRWYPMLALGSFVAEDPTGSVFVAPMLANGERSTYEGEIVPLDADSRELDPALDARTRRFLMVGKIADGFRSVLRSWLTETQLLEIDARNALEPGGSQVCHSHDFCDSNMAMLEAVEKVIGREMNIGDDEDNALFNDAWSLAFVDGFSSYTPTADDLPQLQQVAANADLGVAEAVDAKWLRLFCDRLSARLVTPAPFDPATDGDRPK